MTRLIRTDDSLFMHDFQLRMQSIRASMQLIEDVVSRVDMFTRRDFMDELFKIDQYADDAAALAARHAACRVSPP